jgi:hypothetical protein
MQAKKGQWVEIHQILLAAGQRATQVPSVTQKVPLEMRARGFLVEDSAQIGDQVTIKTLIGRTISGQLSAINPRYMVDYGIPQVELLGIGEQVRSILGGMTNE